MPVLKTIKTKANVDLFNCLATRWIFTLNNYTPDHVKTFETIDCSNETIIRAIQCQSEKGKEKETPHLQGFIILNSQLRGPAVQRLFNMSKILSLRKMLKSTECSLDYTSKRETFDEEANIFISRGDFETKQGKRTDLKHNIKPDRMKDIITDLKNGIKLTKAIEGREEIYVRNCNGLKDLSNKYQKDRTEKTYVIVRYGQSGTGKSESWTDNFNSDNIYVLPDSNGSNVWWDGYDSQDTSVIDDWNNNLPLKYMLNLMDKTPMIVNIKGGTVKFNSKKLIITANKSPIEWFPNIDRDSEHYIALLRRIDECYHHVRDDDPIDGKHKEPENVTQKLKDYIGTLKEKQYSDKLSGYNYKDDFDENYIEPEKPIIEEEIILNQI